MNEHDGDITPGMNSYYGDDVPNVAPPVKQKKLWGQSGKRYDEECARCGQTTVIDNVTDLCSRCGK